MYQALMLPEKVVVQFESKKLYEECHYLAYHSFDKRFSPIPGVYNHRKHPMELKRFKTVAEFRRYLSNLN